MTEAILHWDTSEWECPKCGRRFPTHYRITKSFWDKRQFGRQYVASQNNVARHVDACRGITPCKIHNRD